MKRDCAILLVESAGFFVKNDGLKRHDFGQKIHDKNNKIHDVKQKIHNEKTAAENYFSERFYPVKVFTGYAGKKDIRRIKMEHGVKLDSVQDVLEEIKTLGYMYTYVIPIFDIRSPDFDELKGEIDTRVSYGCFADIIMAEGIEFEEIHCNPLSMLAEKLEEIML